MALIPLLLALVTALVLVPPFARMAGALELVDRPGPLKPQARAVPYLGGAAVLCSCAPLLAVTAPRYLVPLAAAVALGTADDVADLPIRWRLVAEVAVGGLLAASVVTPGGAVGWLLAVAALVAVVNAVNMIDGLDGLAAGVGTVSLLSVAAVAGGSTRDACLAVAGALVGFLWFNRPPARVYLGDGGAYLLGTAVVGVSLDAAAGVGDGGSIVGAVAVVVPAAAVPLAELASTVARRTRTGSLLVAGDRSHSYDVLRRAGVAVGHLALGFAAAQAAVGALLRAPAPARLWAAALLVAGATVVAAARPPARVEESP